MVTEEEVGAAVVAMLNMPGLCGADIDLSAGHDRPLSEPGPSPLNSLRAFHALSGVLAPLAAAGVAFSGASPRRPRLAYAVWWLPAR